MCSRRIAVLKFGSSVLRAPVDVARVAQEIYRWRRKGYQVVAVVSAIGNTTDRLTQTATSFDTDSDPHKFAALLATGERQSAALVGLGLDRAGLTSSVCDEVVLDIRTRGKPLNAEPVSLDCDTLLEKLDLHGVVVVPGFIGRDDKDNICLLGRGGSDLTALFIARETGATVCRLVKDVAGLYEFDPNSADDTKPRRFAHVTYDLALHLDENIVQHKGVRYAQRERLTFEVGTLFSDDVSIVGEFASSTFAPSQKPARPVRVAILGLGTVGFGVWHRLAESLPGKFEIVAVAVRDIDNASAAGVHASILTDDPFAAINSNCDVVVELIGGTDLTFNLVKHALETGRNVVTANKSLLARFGNELTASSRRHGALLAWSASVGGAAHVLETVRQLAAQGDRVTRVRGLLNGTTNYVLGRIAEGATLPDAVEDAKLNGLAEADPHRDLSGVDAAEKLVLVARECGIDLKVEDIVCQNLDNDAIPFFAESDQAGLKLAIRQVVTWDVSGLDSVPQVSIEQVDVSDPLAEVHGTTNRVLLTLESGEVVSVSGVGAGRWPTTSAVVADLIDIAHQINEKERDRETLESEVVSSRISVGLAPIGINY